MISMSKKLYTLVINNENLECIKYLHENEIK